MSNRNSNAHFELVPHADIERSTFDRSFNVKTSFDVGELIPFCVEEVLPGDTFNIKTAKVARLQTLITPIMDNLFLDTYYFFVPNRLIWDHWKEFCGENPNSAWTSTVEYTMPQVSFPADNGWQVGTIADYMGVPLGVPRNEELGQDGYTINALPFRAYTKIVNDWFRDENLQREAYLYTGDEVTEGLNEGTSASAAQKYYDGLIAGAKPFIAAKTHDYFTSCLPAPQRGEAVDLLADTVFDVRSSATLIESPETQSPLKVQLPYHIGTRTGVYPIGVNLQSATSDSVSDIGTISSSQTHTFSDYNRMVFANLHAFPNPLTVNDVRQAFAIQRMLEADARGGVRYIELLKAHFGITSPDARLQRSEYLGGNRCPLNVEQVVQTSSTDSTSPIGSTAGYSQTADFSDDVVKSFTEHGYIIGLMVCRYDHTYQNNLEKMWTRKSRYDFYWPALAHLGEQAVKKREIYLLEAADADQYDTFWNSTFGYQEAWAEYRYKPNYITGLMRSPQYYTETNYQSLDMWHFADDYDDEGQPILSSSWIMEDKTNVDRTLAVTSEVANQIFIDIMVNSTVTRPLPLYSIPGLIDHF